MGMVLYLTTNKIPYISFGGSNCCMFTNNIKASHETDVNSICCYFQGTKYKVLVFNPSNKMLVYCYAEAYFAQLWGHENPQESIYDRIMTIFVLNLDKCTLL